MKEIWEININQEDKNSLLGKIDYVITDNESVFIRTFDALKSYSQSSGALNWEIELKHWNNELCYNNDVILIGVENKLYCVNKSHGEINWIVDVQEGAISKTQLINNKCWVIAGNKIHEYSINGELLNLWNIEVKDINFSVIKSAYFKDELLYFIISAYRNIDYFLAYDYKKGEVLWKREVDNQGKYLFNRLNVEGSLFILTTDIINQKKHIFISRNGDTILQKHDINAYAVVNSEIILMANNRQVSLVKSSDGEELFSIKNTENQIVLNVIQQDELFYCLFATEVIVINKDGEILNEVSLKDTARDIYLLNDNNIIITFTNNSVKAFRSLT